LARNVGNYYIKALYTLDIFAHNIAIKIYCNKKYCDKEYCDKNIILSHACLKAKVSSYPKKSRYINKPKIKVCF